MLENTKGTIQNGQPRETDSIAGTQDEDKKHNTICVGHHYR